MSEELYVKERRTFEKFVYLCNQKQLNNDDYGNNNRKKTQCTAHHKGLEPGKGFEL